MNSSVCVVTLLFLSLENVAAIICNSSPAKPKPTVQENIPSTETPEFLNRSEEAEADIYCESTELYHQWYQGYQNSTSKKQEAIGNIPLQWSVTKTHYVITVEKFDDNTVIYCENDTKSHDVPKKPFIWFLNENFAKKYSKTKILVHDEAPPKIEGPAILTYSEKKNTSFSCKKYAEEKNNTFVGVINTTSNMIKTFLTISAELRFKKADNGTILCCIYYDVNGTANEKRITRHVAKKTLLVYDDSILQDSLEGNEIPSTDTDQTSNHTTTIYITTAVAGVLILLAIIVIFKRRCRKKPISDSKVLYVDLDLLRNVRPDSISRPGPEEESPYAQIIGVLKPDQ